MATLTEVVEHLDSVLCTAEVPDYPNALNGLQLSTRAPSTQIVRRIVTAVDYSTAAVAGAVERGADLLIVHHGMFWGGLQPINGPRLSNLADLIAAGVAVYASHLPLDLHPEFGNNTLLARELGLDPDAGFARFRSIEIGVSGKCDLSTADLVNRAQAFAQTGGHHLVVTPFDSQRRSHRWGICTGAGASSTTIQEAMERGIDTLIVGEGPHHTSVEARDLGLVIVYAGHYATETLGVRALGNHLSQTFGVDATFVDAPTGL